MKIVTLVVSFVNYRGAKTSQLKTNSVICQVLRSSKPLTRNFYRKDSKGKGLSEPSWNFQEFFKTGDLTHFGWK